jgi:HAD superfamily 5'-nucleotidase-like hydrolase
VCALGARVAPKSDIAPFELPRAGEREVSRARRVYANRHLRLDEVEVIGFDMDYTLAIYHQQELEELSYRCTLRKLIDNKGYPDEILRLTYDTAFGVRGVVVDRPYGNVFKMDRHGNVGRVFHGLTPVPPEAVRALYGQQRIRLSAPRYACIDTLFALPEPVMYASLVSHFDATRPSAGGGGSALKSSGRYAKLWDDIRQSIDEAHRDGTMKSVIQAELPRYLLRDPDLAMTLHKFRSSGKKLFLLTNSEWTFTDRVMTYLLEGQLPTYPTWRHYFDVIITSAQKPLFFTERHPLYEIDSAGKILHRAEGPLQRGHIYQGGNVRGFEELIGAGGDRVFYVGDHIYGDMLRAKKSSVWRTAMIVQELEAELGLHEQLEDRLNELRGLERRRAQVDSEITYQQMLLKWLQRAGETDAVTADATRRHTQQSLSELRQALREVDRECATLQRELDRAFNPYWGPLFKEGDENSRFGEQAEDYACLYTGRVSNFLAYSPLQHFRSPRDYMPHELG